MDFAHTQTKALDIDFEGLPIDDKADLSFSERAQGLDQIYTYHVDRGKFDLLMLPDANKFGAKVYEGVTVQGVDFSDPKLAAINYTIGKKVGANTRANGRGRNRPQDLTGLPDEVEDR